MIYFITVFPTVELLKAVEHLCDKLTNYIFEFVYVSRDFEIAYQFKYALRSLK